MIMLLLNRKNAFGEKALVAHLDRSVDSRLRRAKEKAQLGWVRFLIVTGNLSLSISQKLAEIEQDS
jgi:hypothetical protein